MVNDYLQAIPRAEISSTDNVKYLKQLSITMDVILKHFDSFSGNSQKSNSVKIMLFELSDQIANIAMNLKGDGAVDPKFNIAGYFRNFRDSFDGFVTEFSKMAKYNKSIYTSMAIEELIRQLTQLS